MRTHTVNEQNEGWRKHKRAMKNSVNLTDKCMRERERAKEMRCKNIHTFTK